MTNSLTSTEREEIEEAVAAGADLLDILVPGWAFKVDLSRLEMEATDATGGTGCIVMQVTGLNYEDALEALGLWEVPPPIASTLSAEWDRRIGSRREVVTSLGFEFDSYEEDEAGYWAWVEEVLDRRPTVLVGGEAA